MALIKKATYGDGFTIDLGDNELSGDFGDQLKLSATEVAEAINYEHLASQIFGRILKQRSDAQSRLIDRVAAELK